MSGDTDKCPTCGAMDSTLAAVYQSTIEDLRRQLAQRDEELATAKADNARLQDEQNAALAMAHTAPIAVQMDTRHLQTAVRMLVEFAWRAVSGKTAAENERLRRELEFQGAVAEKESTHARIAETENERLRGIIFNTRRDMEGNPCPPVSRPDRIIYLEKLILKAAAVTQGDGR